MKRLAGLLLFCACSVFSRAQPQTELLPVKRAVRVGILGWIQGHIPLEFEQRLGRKFSLVATAGFTSRSPFNEFYGVIWRDGNESENFTRSEDPSVVQDVYDQYRFSGYSHRQASVGYMSGIGTRFYPKRKMMQGRYFGLDALYRQFSSRSELADETAPAGFSYSGSPYPRLEGVYQDEEIKAFDCLLSLGNVISWSPHITVSYSFQLGARFQSATMHDLGVIRINNQYYARNAVHKIDGIRPLIGFELAVGGWW